MSRTPSTTPSTASTVRWLDSATPSGVSLGVTFGLPWQRGICPGQHARLVCRDSNNNPVPLQSWTSAYWPDGSAKWTAHALTSRGPSDGKPVSGYHIALLDQAASEKEDEGPPTHGLTVTTSPDGNVVSVDTGRVSLTFPTSGPHVVGHIRTAAGHTVGQDGHLVLQSQTTPATDDEQQEGPLPSLTTQISSVQSVVVEQSGPVRAVVAVRCRHEPVHASAGGDLSILLRFYLYAGSDVVRIVHTLTVDADPAGFFVRGIGIRFSVPLAGTPLYDRHIRLGGTDAGILAEAVQGITGLWRDPGEQVRAAQRHGRPTPPVAEWNEECSRRLQYVPAWGDYRLHQLSPDGFTAAKRTGPGHAWINIPGGTRASGLVFAGSAATGGLGLGQRYFWERYPTGVDIRGAATDAAQLTTWLYSPAAPPMDLRAYHDGLGQTTYAEQLDALQLTYEDWEPRLGSPVGVARTNEVYLFAVDGPLPTAAASALSSVVRQPPVLVARRDVLYHSGAVLGWSPIGEEGEEGPPRNGAADAQHTSVASRLDFLFRFYAGQIQQRRWFGFWDHGDIMHTYDADRHCWRYDVGGYAWDNSELSPDLWLWLYFLATGRADVYRVAAALTRHTSEVDAYHVGPFVGLGTRHGVQHWSDSCKQARVANALYRRVFYYLAGADERTGELLAETLSAEQGLVALDPYRKVRPGERAAVSHPPGQSGLPSPHIISLATDSPDDVVISLGTDWSALAAAWLTEHERRGPRAAEARSKLVHGMAGIARLANGFVTGYARYDTRSGAIAPPPHDPANAGTVRVSHLSAMFGLVEVCAELLADPGLVRDAAVLAGDDAIGTRPGSFEQAWLDYGRYFNGSAEEQTARYGVPFGKLQLRQGHARLTAYAAGRLDDAALRGRAWREFDLDLDGYGDDQAWEEQAVAPEESLSAAATEVPWVSTNITALYGLAAIQNLAFLGGAEGRDRQ